MSSTFHQATCRTCDWVSVPTISSQGAQIAGDEHVNQHHPDGADIVLSTTTDTAGGVTEEN